MARGERGVSFWKKWFPWRYLVRKAAESHDIVDPLDLLARLERLAEPSEVAHPLELIRAGIAFHARGLINARVFQNNLDWIWPYWVHRQFDPRSPSFLPRGFTPTHVNLTHRNWTALGLPDCAAHPLVDPAGMLTPLLDGWSLEAWILAGDGSLLVPSRVELVEQELDTEGWCVRTAVEDGKGRRLVSRAWVELGDDGPTCRYAIRAESADPASLVISLRPYNPEGVSFIHGLRRVPDGWLVDEGHRIRFSRSAADQRFADFRHGDVAHALSRAPSDGPDAMDCPAGMVTAAALYPLVAGEGHVELEIPLPEAETDGWNDSSPRSWSELDETIPRLELPDERFRHLFDAACRSLLLLTPGEVYPGPFTYRRFWFRDAAFLLDTALCCTWKERVERTLRRFPERQDRRGFFLSQEGEWDANGEVLWLFERSCSLGNRPPSSDWYESAMRGADWICRKRRETADHPRWPGLLPPGFSAEHLGPNDYYFWDDFWAVAGLRAAASLARRHGDASRRELFTREALAMWADVEHAMAEAAHDLARSAIPAAPGRRLDSGAVGSLVACYPLGLLPATDERLGGTVDHLCENCLVHGVFFQDMIHSGLNVYLSLHLAQVLLRRNDARWRSLVDRVARLASPTGQWPEAIHPRTLGGCMGDGHHGWAAAEWIRMMRALFIREDGGRLVLGSGISPDWIASGGRLSFGPTASPLGNGTIEIQSRADGTIRVSWTGEITRSDGRLEVALPGHAPLRVAASDGACLVAD